MGKLLLLAITLTLSAARAATPLEYFKSNYAECDAHFTEIFSRLSAQNPKAQVYQFLYNEGNIKSYFIPATESPDNLLILIAGTHGIEAFAGSAVQRYLLDQPLNLKKTSLLLIHGFNLYGFKNERRVNENNMDLNRSFILDRSAFRPDDQKYAQIETFLNPAESPSLGLLSKPIFLIRSVAKILQYSMDTLRTSVLRGQYSFPKGVFYGGKEPSAQELLIDQLVARYVQDSYKKIMLVDLHTGYGQKGKLHLLAGKTLDPNSIRLTKIFGEGEVDFSDKKNFYAVEGEMLVFFGSRIAAKNKAAEVTGVTFEFGTLDSQKTLGSIESLRRVVLENQNFHYPADADTSAEIKRLYREMFYPSDSEWREAVLKQAGEKIQKVFSYLN